MRKFKQLYRIDLWGKLRIHEVLETCEPVAMDSGIIECYHLVTLNFYGYPTKGAALKEERRRIRDEIKRLKDLLATLK